MEHKFIIEVILKYEGPKQEIGKSNPDIQLMKIDTKMLQNLLGPLIQNLGNSQLNLKPLKEDEKKE